MANITLSEFTDDALIAETRRVVDAERRSTAELLQLLNEIERRRLHLALGYSSLFAYCTRAWALSEQAAYSRITAARASRRFPVLIGRLTTGALTLSSVGILAPHLTEENVDALLEAADRLSTREVERLIAVLHPQPDVESSVRALPTKATTAEPAAALRDAPRWGATRFPGTECRADGSIERHLEPTGAGTVTPAIVPIAPRRYLLRITIGEDAHSTLERLRALLRHSIPNGDPGGDRQSGADRVARADGTDQVRSRCDGRDRPQHRVRTDAMCLQRSGERFGGETKGDARLSGLTAPAAKQDFSNSITSCRSRPAVPLTPETCNCVVELTTHMRPQAVVSHEGPR